MPGELVTVTPADTLLLPLPGGERRVAVGDVLAVLRVLEHCARTESQLSVEQVGSESWVVWLDLDLSPYAEGTGDTPLAAVVALARQLEGEGDDLP